MGGGGAEKCKREPEKVPAEARRNSPSLQVQLLEPFQMCVRALRVIGRRLRATLARSPAPTRPIFSLSVSFISPPPFSPLSSCRLRSSHVIDSSRHQRQKHARARAAQQNRSSTAGIHGIKAEGARPRVCVRVCVSTCVCVCKGHTVKPFCSLTTRENAQVGF